MPLALLDAPWRDDGRILVLEPRRLATRAAARRMAETLGEKVGENRRLPHADGNQGFRTHAH
ncbi:hypothetical protein [Breoghania sp.]|uniref:hypothetical protein n=1 Tax=Breoghania sp. TaxID=2065378 RepID=UPI003204A8CD